MGPDQMKKIAAAASAGFAMQITAQMNDMTQTADPATYDADWAREMLGDLKSDQGIADMANEVGVENIGPTPKQRSRIDEMKEQFPDLMNFDEEEPGLDAFDGSSNFDGIDIPSDFDPSQNLEIPMDEIQRDDPFSPKASNSSNLIRLAAHLDSVGHHDMADELDGAAFSDIEEFLSKLPMILEELMGKGPKKDGTGPHNKICPKSGEPCKCGKVTASTRMAQVAMDEVGVIEDDIDLEENDDQSKVVSFDPERMTMVVQTPDGLFKLYEASGVSPDGKPRFEFKQIIDSPDDRVDEALSSMASRNPRNIRSAQMNYAGFIQKFFWKQIDAIKQVLSVNPDQLPMMAQQLGNYVASNFPPDAPGTLPSNEVQKIVRSIIETAMTQEEMI